MARAGRLILGIPAVLFGAWLLLVAICELLESRLTAFARTTPHERGYFRGSFVDFDLGPWHARFDTDSWKYAGFCFGLAAIGIGIATVGLMVILTGRKSSPARE